MLRSVIRKNLPALILNTLKLNEHPARNVVTILKLPENVRTAHNLNLAARRYKSKKRPSKGAGTESESEDGAKSEDEAPDRHSKIIKTSVSSMRMDAVLKTGLGMARNKIETLFYESKIRLNGERVLKKSKSVKVGDEIDIIKGADLMNSNFLVVSRVEVLQADALEDRFKVKLRRSRSLTIENYRDQWKGGPQTP